MTTRIAVVGNSGAGKTWLASRIASTLNLPHLELDSLFHRANWTPAPQDEFRADVTTFIADAEAHHHGWVIDGNYRGQLGDVVASRADTVVWLDYPRALVMTRVIRRTLARLLLRRRLWQGNRERWTSMLQKDPERNIVLWSWTRDAEVRARFLGESAASRSTWLRFRSPAETERWLRTLDARG